MHELARSPKALKSPEDGNYNDLQRLCIDDFRRQHMHGYWRAVQRCPCTGTMILNNVTSYWQGSLSK